MYFFKTSSATSAEAASKRNLNKNGSSFLSLSPKNDNLRYHRFAENYLSGKLGNFSTDWGRFPGLPVLLPGEALWLNHGQLILTFFRHCWPISVVIASFYLAGIYILQKKSTRKVLKNEVEKESYLRKLYIFWNLAMAAFSLIGFSRCAPEHFDLLKREGFVATYSKSTSFLDARINTWHTFFAVSKVLQLLDTVFFVVVNSRTISIPPLHWIHHSLTLVYTWFAFGDIPATARWMANMNLGTHSILYLYLAVREVPSFKKQKTIRRFIGGGITLLNVLQMFVGLYLNAAVLWRKLLLELPCDVSPAVATAGLALYSLFAGLYVHLLLVGFCLKRRKSDKLEFLKPTIKFEEMVNGNKHSPLDDKKWQ